MVHFWSMLNAVSDQMPFKASDHAKAKTNWEYRDRMEKRSSHIQMRYQAVIHREGRAKVNLIWKLRDEIMYEYNTV